MVQIVDCSAMLAMQSAMLCCPLLRPCRCLLHVPLTWTTCMWTTSWPRKHWRGCQLSGSGSPTSSNTGGLSLSQSSGSAAWHLALTPGLWAYPSEGSAAQSRLSTNHSSLITLGLDLCPAGFQCSVQALPAGSAGPYKANSTERSASLS